MNVNSFFMYKIVRSVIWVTVCVVTLTMYPLDVFAQAKNVTLTVYRIEDVNKKNDRKPWNSQRVYGFFSSAKFNQFKAKCEDARKRDMTYVPAKESEYDVLVETDVDGSCTLLIPLSGYIIIKPDGAEAKYEPIRGRVNIELNIVASKSLKQVTITVPPPVRPRPQIPNSCGNRLEFEYQYPLGADLVNVKSRILIRPLVTVIETGDTLGYLAPYVKDGKDFVKANLRRMGFDETRDPLYRYRCGIMRESNKRDSLPIHFVLEPIDRKLHYKVTGDMIFGMNTKTPYRVDSICLAEGPVYDPMRFLDYDLIEVPIDRKRYERRGKAEFSKDHEKLNLNFVVGEARLDPSDTANVIQLEKLKKNLARYMDANSGITGAVIHGSASPEGGIALNERLCRSRADFLREELKSFPALQEAWRSGEVKTTAKVASWEKVADQLSADSLKVEEEMVRSVLKFVKDPRKQEEQIRKLPCWEVIEKQILPKLRYVDIEYFYYTNRVKSRQEIWQQYQKEEEYRQGKRQVPYEFYQLLDMIKDPAEKEPIARAAYESVKDEGGDRPWPLAAYDLARCYAARGAVDTTLLLPYLDTVRTKEYRKTDFETGSYVGWYNDPAIVTMHINMLCKAGDFAKAYVCAYTFLPKEPKYNRLRMFLRCLNCEWDNPEVMDTVSNSSYWNKIVILAAQRDFANRSTALYMLNDAAKVNQADPKTLYMKAQLLFDLYGKHQKSTVGYKDANFMFDEFFEPSADDPYVDSYGFGLEFWGLPMAQCCALDEKYYDIMLWDGEFNEDYRKAFKAYWKKVKDGTLPRPKIPEATAQGGEPQDNGNDEDILDEAFGLDE